MTERIFVLNVPSPVRYKDPSEIIDFLRKEAKLRNVSFSFHLSQKKAKKKRRKERALKTL